MPPRSTGSSRTSAHCARRSSEPMPGLHDLPTVNAFFNALSGVLLVSGYLLYHAQVGSVHFKPQGPIRTVYFTILISHTILAAAVAPMAVVTLVRALRGRFAKHRALARLTLPIWLYVNLTGVVVYVMLYHL